MTRKLNKQEQKQQEERLIWEVEEKHGYLSMTDPNEQCDKSWQYQKSKNSGLSWWRSR